jgi:hypothetical protein
MSSIQKTETKHGGIFKIKKDKMQNPNRGHFRPGFFVAAFSSGDGFFIHAPTPPKPTSLMIAVLELLHH